MGLTTNYKNSEGTDIGSDLVEKSYLIDRYPELVNTFRFAGLWGWGDAGSAADGALGDNTTTDRSSPVQTVAAGTNWKQVAGGANHTAAIKTDGTLWTWGTNAGGVLGDNVTATTAGKSSPIQTVSAGTNWKQVSCGSYHMASIKTDGTLWLWGSNRYGNLGNNTITHRSSPVQTVSGGTNWKQVSSGRSHVAAIKTDGTLWLWGNGTNGILGNNAITNRSSPVQTVSGGTNWKLVACGSYHTAAIKTDGTLWLWGQNSDGRLGDNTVASKSSPVQTVSAGTNWKQVAIGGTISNGQTAAIKTDGTLWTWGRNASGQLGDNTVASKSSPVQTVAAGTNWNSVACGRDHMASIKTDGTLWLWGSGGTGRLGDNTTTAKSSPIQTVSGGTNWKLVACGLYHTACIRDDSMDDM